MKNPTPSTRGRGRPRFAADLRVSFCHSKVKPATVAAFRKAAKRDGLSVGQVLDQLGKTLNS